MKLSLSCVLLLSSAYASRIIKVEVPECINEMNMVENDDIEALSASVKRNADISTINSSYKKAMSQVNELLSDPNLTQKYVNSVSNAANILLQLRHHLYESGVDQIKHLRSRFDNEYREKMKDIDGFVTANLDKFDPSVKLSAFCLLVNKNADCIAMKPEDFANMGLPLPTRDEQTLLREFIYGALPLSAEDLPSVPAVEAANQLSLLDSSEILFSRAVESAYGYDFLLGIQPGKPFVCPNIKIPRSYKIVPSQHTLRIYMAVNMINEFWGDFEEERELLESCLKSLRNQVAEIKAKNRDAAIKEAETEGVESIQAGKKALKNLILSLKGNEEGRDMVGFYKQDKEDYDRIVQSIEKLLKLYSFDDDTILLAQRALGKEKFDSYRHYGRASRELPSMSESINIIEIDNAELEHNRLAAIAEELENERSRFAAISEELEKRQLITAVEELDRERHRLAAMAQEMEAERQRLALMAQELENERLRLVEIAKSFKK